jgi:3-deoxy-D-manno-octulosonic-acid transferase
MSSSREGEEAPLLAAWAALPAPRPLLLLVPRHPQRFDAVAALVTAAGLTLQRRTAWAATPPPEAAAADVWLGDSLGEMPLYYALADVALLGGSFAPLGGQNLIEAAACGCPLLMGPHTFNFAQAAELAQAAGAAERLPGIEAGVIRAVALCDSPQRLAMGERALGFAAVHRGAAARLGRAVLSVLLSARAAPPPDPCG